MCSRRRRHKKSKSHIRKEIERRGPHKHSRSGKDFPAGISAEKLKQESKKKAAYKRITGRRLWLFRIITPIIIPVIFFGLLEVALRVAGYGYPTSAIIECKGNKTLSYCYNMKFTWRFFHPNIARQASSFVFPAKKSENTYRIFVLGASAAAGIPDGAYCFGRILRVMLEHRYPQAEFEVITVAMPAINSHVVLEMAKDCARHQPDLFVIYLGNNEVVGPYGTGTVFTPFSSNLSMIRLSIALKATKLGQLITNLMRLTGTSNDLDVWSGMATYLDKQVRADEPNLEIVYSHFQRNLQDISKTARRSGAKIIFSTVPVNLKDNPPFASLHRSGLSEPGMKKWNELYQKGIKYEQADDFTKAVELYLSAGEIDDSFADLQFRLGRCYWQTREFSKARDRFLRACELDTLRFRADTRINDVIRKVTDSGSAEGVYLVDSVKVYEDSSPHRTPGEELFYEHVHINFKGACLLADAIAKQVENILPERIERYRVKDRSRLTEKQCEKYLGYTVWDRYKIAEEVLSHYIKEPPFTNQLYHGLRVKRMEWELRQLMKECGSEKVLEDVQDQYRWAINQSPSDWRLHWKYGWLLKDLGRYDAAVEQYLTVLKLVPHYYPAYAKLCFIFSRQGKLNAAVENGLKAVKIYPICVDAYYNMGVSYQALGSFNKAIKCYSRAVEFAPYQVDAYNNLGLLLFKQGKYDKALEIYHKGLELAPDDLKLHYNLGILYASQGRRYEAEQELRAALKIDPNENDVRMALEMLLQSTPP